MGLTGMWGCVWVGGGGAEWGLRRGGGSWLGLRRCLRGGGAEVEWGLRLSKEMEGFWGGLWGWVGGGAAFGAGGGLGV